MSDHNPLDRECHVHIEVVGHGSIMKWSETTTVRRASAKLTSMLRDGVGHWGQAYACEPHGVYRCQP